MNEVLISSPIFVEKVWGDKKLNELFKKNGMDKIGEVWLFSGVEKYETELIGLKSGKSYGRPSKMIKELLGKDFPRIPLLLKLISTTQWLSIQVHPDDKFANEIENEPWGKTEAWYFLNEKNEIFISNDIKKNIKAIEEQKWEEIFKPTILNKNDLLFIPAGVVHTLGPNSMLLEIQQTSDLTYRLYDWGRPREVHIEKGKKFLKDSPFVIANSPEEFKTQYFNIKKVKNEIIKGFGIFVSFKDFKTIVIPKGLDYKVEEFGLLFFL
ncbi:mannose-6-phosphate isomerase, type 1 [Marinitoga hydrogenitolerans DSM 16785]|uniref:Mannose-6-phosphate isomerase, type 1 n=1 Tax=Marinitoga hydrogenitolerans (strain DSM 16785 / JCM 12826 / AT1271) TaxID=1122195 RepID=A0A1M4TAL2_MARH1|nr:type I phosphomannose isomerase catalytic subunit [Marinitoga hydrogenitolerans]SHE41465.1 mannose-6-phosphate isomerase, type 1 [Marinitoga hydrogenitolerans DSM 16785]